MKTATITKTAAIRQATEDVTMYRQGSGWIVSTYDPKAQANRLSHEMPHAAARPSVTAGRTRRALELLGIDCSPSSEYRPEIYEDGYGTVAERVTAVLAEVTR